MEMKPQLSHTAHKVLTDFQHIPIKFFNNGYKDVVQFTMDVTEYNRLLKLLEEVENLGVEIVPYRRVRVD